jgi:DUSP domain
VNFTKQSLHDIASDNESYDGATTFYDKPNKIENIHLLDSDLKLLPSVVEHFDFEVVSFDVWQHFDSWYQSDHKICRRLVKDTMN